MNEQFEAVVHALLSLKGSHEASDLQQMATHFDEAIKDEAKLAQSLNSAFLMTLAGEKNPEYEAARQLLETAASSPKWAKVAQFYREGVGRIQREIEAAIKQYPDFAANLENLAGWLIQNQSNPDSKALSEHSWSIFYPEATNIRDNKEQRVQDLRAKRTVTINKLAENPLSDPASQVLFTSNVLLTVPLSHKTLDNTPLSSELKTKISQMTDEPQLYWYDHPIPIGIEPEANEVLYGLRGLETALEVERERGNLRLGQKVSCVLSVSVTHKGLQEVAKQYLEEELSHYQAFQNLNIYAFSEAETQRIINEVLVPAARHYLGREDAQELLEIFGVDGEYGRHYSFLKAILAIWNLFSQPEVKATFKIDLDQIFPQKELIEQAGSSMLEHFKTPLWGAEGTNSDGQPVELGMIAGALVNEKDIAKSLFYPDVLFPNRALTPDEYIFFSGLPQALSTEAEMMTRYEDNSAIDGKTRCIQRIHVTGGTNGILVDSLRRYRPFTPSFIGRAEDQAYILSVFPEPGTRLAYVHQDGLIMRHDKEAFAQEAMQAAFVGKLTGDYIRLLYYSAYARALTGGDISSLKAEIDPFTGGFVSRIPQTVAYLRFGFKADGFFASGNQQHGLEFITMGTQRINTAINFVQGEDSQLKRQYEQEAQGWSLFYDILETLESKLQQGDGYAQELGQKVSTIIEDCFIHVA